MMRVKEVFDRLNRLYPTETAADFDNVGLLVGDGEAEVTKVLVCLDCDLSAIKRAEEIGANLILSHHPVIFEPLRSVTAESAVYRAVQSGIAVISMHTNLDIAVGGVNEQLCRSLGFENFQKIEMSDGFSLLFAETAPISADRLAERLKTALSGNIRYTDGKKAIKKILFCCGSGGSYANEASKKGFDALITADVKHNQFVDAQNRELSLFDSGHYASEDIVIEPLAAVLRAEAANQFPVETYHPDFIKYLGNQTAVI